MTFFLWFFYGISRLVLGFSRVFVSFFLIFGGVLIGFILVFVFWVMFFMFGLKGFLGLLKLRRWCFLTAFWAHRNRPTGGFSRFLCLTFVPTKAGIVYRLQILRKSRCKAFLRGSMGKKGT